MFKVNCTLSVSFNPVTPSAQNACLFKKKKNQNYFVCRPLVSMYLCNVNTF